MRSLVLASVASLLAFAVACGGNSPEPATPSTEAPAAAPAASAATASTAAAPLVAPGEAKVGDKSLCPVSGEEFTIDANSPKYEYKGKTYYFCCSGCDKKFQKEPEKYLGKLAK
jgi:YHS domain-containing protein